MIKAISMVFKNSIIIRDNNILICYRYLIERNNIKRIYHETKRMENY